MLSNDHKLTAAQILEAHKGQPTIEKRLFNASLQKKGMADIPETVYPSGFSEDTGEYTIWEQPSRWGLWGIRGR